jgi:type VII secretion-associated serine protease mycosin
VLVGVAVAVLSLPAAQLASPAQPSRPAARTAPADLYRGQQWTLDALHISRAWKYSRGNGVTVAVLDTGVDGHQPDLSGRVIDGPDFTGHTRKPGSRYWGRHGTEMASIIAGHGHGSGAAAGVMGVAPDAKILSIRVTWDLGDPIRTDRTQVERARDAVAKGIRYAADHGAQVISMSLGGGNLFYNGNASEEAAIKYALGKGTVLIASAGNDGNAANRRIYPAAYPGVVAVGAVDRAFKPAKFTNRHTYISVAAPGVEIVSADVAGHGYILGTGTSSSAAFVAGMSALVKARYPKLTPSEVKQALEEGATHRPPDGRSSDIGTGVADAYGALRTAARINKAEHGGSSLPRPQPTSRPAPPPSEHGGPDLILISVIIGGGTLIVLSLILGWRQRRRPSPAEKGDDELPEPTFPVPARPPSDSGPWERRPAPPPRTDQSPSGLSPWERRPPETAAPSPGEAPQWNIGPPDPPAISPGERHRPADSWELSPHDSPWDRNSFETPSPGPAGDPFPAETPSSWEPHPFDAPPPPDSWDLPPAETPPFWDRRSLDAPPPPDSGDLPPAEAQPPSAANSWDLPSNGTGGWDHPSAETPPPAGAAPRTGPPQPYEPPPVTSANDNGSNGHRPLSPDFRVGDGPEPDPLTDAPIDSSTDVGTPLADESWDSIRRGFDRLKDASNWESLAKGGLDDTGSMPAQDAFDETASIPIIQPHEENDD